MPGYRRLLLLDHDGIRGLFFTKLAGVCEAHQFRLLACEFMPEYVHLLLFPDADLGVWRFTHAMKRPFPGKPADMEAKSVSRRGDAVPVNADLVWKAEAFE